MFNKSHTSLGLTLVIFLSLTLSGNRGLAANESRSPGPTVRSQVAKILLSSLGGAVLGISTLSFYDRPQDHLSNVAIGGTLGAVLGSIYVTKESLDYESMATIQEGGLFQVLALPENLGVMWKCSF
jgi:hypothetical protein